MKKSTNLRLGELFCGPGGIGCGAKKSTISIKERSFGFKHIWATDYHKDSCDTYRNNLNVKQIIHLPIEKLFLDKNKLRNMGKVDCLTFGFPCNDFSNVGEKKGFKGKFGPLYTYCVGAVNFFKPDVFIAENVSGMKSSHEGKAFRRILNELEKSGKGYTLSPHLYKFEQYGIPQSRHRIIIVGIKKTINKRFKVPAPKFYDPKDYVSCGEALKGIPRNALNNEFTKNSPQVIERLKHIRPGENAFNANLPKHLRLNVKGAKISQIYRRLDSKKPSYTVTGSGGGGTHIYHWKHPRALTNRERARLQTFPDRYEFSGSKESQRRQIGMAVPVLGAKLILTNLLKTLHGVEYKSVPNNINLSVYTALEQLKLDL